MTEPRIVSIGFRASRIVVEFLDGRHLSVPLAWYPTLAQATAAQLNNFQITSGGEGVIWDDLDEALSGRGFLAGQSHPPFSREKTLMNTDPKAPVPESHERDTTNKGDAERASYPLSEQTRHITTEQAFEIGQRLKIDHKEILDLLANS